MESKSESKFKPTKKTKKRPSSKSLRKTIKNKTISHHEKIIHIDTHTKILRAYHNKTQDKNKKKELMKKLLKYNKKKENLQNVIRMYPNLLHKHDSNTKNNDYNPKEKAQELRNKINQFEEYKKNRDYKLSKAKNSIIEILKSNKTKRKHRLSNQITTATIQKELDLFYLKHPEFRPSSQRRTYYSQRKTYNPNPNANYNLNF
jgi:hypothetical protein